MRFRKEPKTVFIMPKNMCGFKEGEAVDAMTMISVLMTHCERVEDDLKHERDKVDRMQRLVDSVRGDIEDFMEDRL